VPYFWMPKYVNAKDASARTLEIYKGEKKMNCRFHIIVGLKYIFVFRPQERLDDIDDVSG